MVIPAAVRAAIAEHARAGLPNEACGLLLLDGDELVYWSASGTVTSQLGMRVKSTRSLSGLCVETGRVLMCNDSETDPRVDIDACRLVGLRSMLVAPLPYGDLLIGVLKVVAPWPNAFHDQDVRTLEHVGWVMKGGRVVKAEARVLP